jgi:phosphoribosylamine--glycine ligase
VKVLVIGNGGREHAIAWKLSQSKHIDKIYSSPGNAGIAEIAECIDISPNDFSSLVDFVKYEWIDLTIVCSEKFISNDIVSVFEREGRRILGPDRTSAQVRLSRVSAKNLMRLHRIPTAEYKVFTSYLHAQDHIRLKGAPIVIKLDGPSEGSGCFIAPTVEEAIGKLKLIMEDRIFGDAGRRVIIEESLKGDRFTFVVLTDGKSILPITSLYIYSGNELGSAAAGAYSPVPMLKEELRTYITEKILGALLKAFRSEGIKYKGFISADLVVNKDEVRVFELNWSFGDLEAQTILPRLGTDLTDLMLAVTDEKLYDTALEWGQNASVCIAGFLKGHLEESGEGIVVSALETIKTMKDVFTFHDKPFDNSGSVTPGGRVVSITATGKDLKDAKAKAYNAIGEIHVEGMDYRDDIGGKDNDQHTIHDA